MKLFQKKTTKLLLILALCIAMFTCFVACEEPGPSSSPSASAQADKTLISNGYFDKTSGTATIKTPTNWTAAAGTGTGGSAPATDNDVLRGVVSIGSITDVDSTLADPGLANTTDSGTGVLMIYNKNATAYRYRSASFSVAKNGTVDVSVNVNTKLESGAARIVVTDGKAPYYVFDNINTNGQWQKYTITLQGNQIASKYVYIELWLGEGGKDDTSTHAKGVAFFDNVTAYRNDISDEAFDQIVTDADSAKFSLRLLNLDFTRQHASGSKKNYATDWSSVTGGATSKKVDNVTRSINRGVFGKDEAFTLSDGTSVTPGTPEGATDDKVLGLESSYFKTSFGYKSSALFVEANANYKISVWVKTVGIEGKGAYVSITDVDNTKFSEISTDGTWVQYHYYVKGSATQDKSIQLELWLGDGDNTSSTNYTQGVAFFDNVTIEKVDTLITEDQENSVTMLVEELYSDNLLSSAPEFDTFEYIENHGTPNTPGVDQISATVSTTATLTEYGLTEAIGGINREGEDNVAYMMYHKNAGATKFDLTDASAITILPNHDYRLSFWIRTIGVEDGKGLTAYLTDVTDSEDVKDVSTLNTLNSECFDEDCTDVHEKWEEVAFYVKGDADKTKTVSLRFALGSGSAEDPSSYVTGYTFISNFYLEQVSATEYSSASTGSNVGKHTFFTSTTSSTTVQNAGFDNFNVKESTLENGQLTNIPGVVDGWTISAKNSSVVSGITTKRVFDNLKANNESTFPAIDFPYDNTELPAIFNGQPNLLMIWNKSDTTFYHKSPNLTLNANSYYRISAQVKTESVLRSGNVEGAYAFVKFATNQDTETIFVNTNDVADNDGWVTVDFYVSSGFASTTVNLMLGLGDGTDSASGVAFFDNVIMSTSTADEFEAATAGTYTKVIDLKAETFDTSSQNYPANPQNYTGTAAEGSASAKAGIINLEDLEKLAEYGDDFIDVVEAFDTDNHSAPYFLFIYNESAGAYSYKRTGVTMTANSTYLVKVKAMATGLTTGTNGKITIDLGNSNTVSLNVSDNEWKEYSFYVTTNSSSASASISYILGEAGENAEDTSKFVKGAIGIDDLTIEKVASTDVPDATNAYTATLTVPEPEPEEDEDDTEDTTTGPSASEIIEIVVASVLSIVVIVVLVWALVKKLAPYVKAKKAKKFARPNEKAKTKPVSKTSQTIDEESND